jgi:hypothetical protein
MEKSARYKLILPALAQVSNWKAPAGLADALGNCGYLIIELLKPINLVEILPLTKYPAHSFHEPAFWG